MIVKDVSAATMYDVLHDGQYRKKWDPAMDESFDIARCSANADVGYYSCEQVLLINFPLCVCPCRLLSASGVSFVYTGNGKGHTWECTFREFVA